MLINNLIVNILLVILAAIMLSHVAVAESPPTNEQFVINTIAESVSDLVDSLRLEHARIYVKPQSGISELAIDGFRTGAMNSGLAVINAENIGDVSSYMAHISLSAFNFAYDKGRSRGFLRKPFIKRRLSGQLLINITQGDFSYLGFMDFSYSDEIEPSQANYVSSVRYNQLSLDPPGGGAMRYLEPLAVTATVGGLIYLFFLNR